MNRSGAVAVAAALCIGVACTEADSTNGATAADAYMAVLDAYSTDEFLAHGFDAATVSSVRPGPYLQHAPSTVYDELQRRGVTVVATGEPLCAGDVRLSFGPALLESDGVYQIDVDVALMSKYNFGDIEYIRYRVDCRNGTCSPPVGRAIDRVSIGGGC
jgi:hypothetical protein